MLVKILSSNETFFFHLQHAALNATGQHTKLMAVD